LAFRWLGDNRPSRSAQGVVHGDFRNGNLIVGPDGIRAVLDWELSHLGDPLEDLGWLCVKAWRFGSPLPVGGFGSVDQLVGAYEGASGTTVDRTALHWWEVLGTLRWGVICIVQTVTHLSGTLRSVELAAIGRRSARWSGISWSSWPEPTRSDPPTLPSRSTRWRCPRTGRACTTRRPALELLDAVREFLVSDVMAGTDGRLRFHARVAANVVAMVGRQIALGPHLQSEHAERLRRLGLANDAELADAIRAGALEARRGGGLFRCHCRGGGQAGRRHPGYRLPLSPT